MSKEPAVMTPEEEARHWFAETKATQDATAKQVASFEDTLKGFDAKLDKFGKPEPKAELPAEAEMGEKAKMEEKAKLGESMVAGLTKFDVQGFPLGQIVVGGVSAVFVTELVDGFMAKTGQGTMVNGLVKAGAAWGVMRYGKRLLGGSGAMAAGILIGFDAVRDLIPIDTFVQGITSRISGAVATRGLASNSRYNVVQQAEAVAGDYYSRAGV